MHKGERSGVTLQTSKDEYTPEKSCDVHFSKVDTESSEYDQMSIRNMFLPVLFFGTCAVLALIMQIDHICKSKRGKESLFGTRSTLNLFTDVPETDKQTSWAKREEKMDGEFDKGMQSVNESRDNGLNGRTTRSKSTMTGSYLDSGAESL